MEDAQWAKFDRGVVGIPTVPDPERSIWELDDFSCERKHKACMVNPLDNLVLLLKVFCVHR